MILNWGLRTPRSVTRYYVGAVAWWTFGGFAPLGAPLRPATKIADFTDRSVGWRRSETGAPIHEHHRGL